MIQAFFCFSPVIPEMCDICHTNEKVLDLYTLLFVYSGLPLCGGIYCKLLHDTKYTTKKQQSQAFSENNFA